MKPTRARAGALIVLLGGATAADGAAPGSRFYPVTPCRAVDTRNAAGPFGGPALEAALPRDFALAGVCGTRTGATALAANVTITAPTDDGELTIDPAGIPWTGTSAISYRTSRTRANNALLTLGPGGVVTVKTRQLTGTAHLIIDIVGYFTNDANDPPVVNAGSDQTIQHPAGASLSGSATDDGVPPSGPITYQWTKVSGPGTATFGSGTSAATSATFDVAGTYVLRLIASDGFKTGADDVKVRVNPTATDVLRFTSQAGFGPSPDFAPGDGLVSQVTTKGFTDWVEEQFTLPSSGWGAWAAFPGTRDTTSCPDNSPCQRDNYSLYQIKRKLFTNGLYGADQLRLRVVWALHKILVVSGRDISMPYRYVPYLNVLDRNAFGNFRNLLEEMTLNAAMGQYLDMATSTRTNPNENYPREIMQLFSIGLERLNLDGTVQVDGQGVPLPTYSQDDVDGFTKVFTGWSYAAQPTPGVTNYQDPMVLTASRHDETAKTFLGRTIPARVGQGTRDLKDAHDILFNHPNVGPFVGKQLIQTLVTSNPSPAYVARVASTFNDNGVGVRGDMKAVIRAILFDPEARGGSVSPTFGHLREPALYMLSILRGTRAKGYLAATASDGYLDGWDTNMGQDVWNPVTVFSYYMPDGEAPGTIGLGPGGAALSGPEFGILTASTSLRRANFVNKLLNGTGTGYQPNQPGFPNSSGADTGSYSYKPTGTTVEIAIFVNIGNVNGAPAIIEEANRLFLAGSMSNEMRTRIQTSIAGMSDMNAIARHILYLVVTSPQFQVER